MTCWHPIETAPHDQEHQILLARFRENSKTPDYVVSASWGVEMPGHTQCASYSGWFVDGVPLENPPRRRRGCVEMVYGILDRGELAPTHWCEVPE